MLKAFAVGAMLAAACVLPGCGAAFIDPGPDHAVKFAIDRLSPAVVRLDVVVEDFSNGTPSTIRAIGSGTIIDKEGRILTNFHVAGRAKDIKITLANKEQVKAHLIGSDHWTDLALVQLDMDDMKARKLTFEFAELGDSSKVVLGQPVMAMGTPYGLTRTLTKGIISNTEREIDASNIDGYETGWFNNWLQMDAAINPGNSGGPLMNLRGEIIGINTRGSPGANNLGFAIPSNVAKEVVRDILKDKKVTRSYIGVQLQPLQDLEKYYDLPADRGVLIRSVEQRDSPAKTAGLQPEDILLAINDKPVAARFHEEIAGVQKTISDFPVGTVLKLSVQRSVAGQVKQLDLTCKTEKLESVVTEEKLLLTWGITVRELTRAYLRAAQMEPVDGILVTGVRSTSVAATAKLRDGDVITAVDKKPVTTIAQLEAAIKEWAAGTRAIGIDVKRDRVDQTLVMKEPVVKKE